MDWADFKVGHLVEAHADDYFQCSGDGPKLRKHEYPFTVAGEIREITQRTMWVIGYWKWHCPTEWCDKNDPQYSHGVFGIPRRGPEKIYLLGRLERVWISPIPN